MTNAARAVASRYARVAAGYRDHWAPVLRHLAAPVVDELLARRPRAVVDLGCGTGAIAAIFAEAGAHVTGVDATPEMLAHVDASPVGRATGVDATPAASAGIDRIAAGELPFAKPERPRGIERNIVITQWDWGSPTAYLHDAISADPRNPRVNANGKIYGSPEDSSDFVPILDPTTNVAAPRSVGCRPSTTTAGTSTCAPRTPSRSCA